MKGWQILQLLNEQGKYLSVSSIYGYARKGYISSPEGPVNSLQSEYPSTAAGEAWAARELLPVTGPSMLLLAREIGLQWLAPGHKNPWVDVERDPQLMKLIQNRPDAAFYGVAWLQKYYELQKSPPPVDLAQLRIALISFATPDDIERRRDEWNKKDIAAIRERNSKELPPLDPLQAAKEQEEMDRTDPWIGETPKESPGDSENPEG